MTIKDLKTIESMVLDDSGAWCWFQDPRAVRHVGYFDRTFWGYVTRNGDIKISSYDHTSFQLDTFTLHSNLEIDDHAAPSILVRSDGRLVVFYCKHNAQTMYWRISVNPEDITSFQLEKRFTGGGLSICYPNPVQLSAEDNKIYLFYRKRIKNEFDIREVECLRISIDGAETFDSEQDVIDLSGRTYVKVISDGIDKIHIAATKSISRSPYLHKHIYYCYYNKGNYYKADGGQLTGSLPLGEDDLENIYNSDVSGNYQAWIWDIALDSSGKPYIVFTAYVSDTDHHYKYARWTGNEWAVHEVTTAGNNLYSAEPHYSGGISLDKENPQTVYLSKFIFSQWELQQWTTTDGGITWSTPIDITLGSNNSNIRPVAVWNHSLDLPVLWLIGTYTTYTDYDTAITGEKLPRPRGKSMTSENEEELSLYKSLTVTPVGIPKDKVPRKTHTNSSDSELAAFYAERYAGVGHSEYPVKKNLDVLRGLCNLVNPGEFYLHVGCSDGSHMAILSGNGIDGIGLDLSVTNILRGRQRYPELKFINGFAEEIPFKDAYFDIVLLGGIVEHLRNPLATLAECLRVAKKGLALCVEIRPVTSLEYINSLSFQSILSLLKTFGLKPTFFNRKGEIISCEESQQLLKTFPWLMVRAEKTSESETKIQNVASSEGEKLRTKATNEILERDQWLYDTEHKRNENEVRRFNFLSNLPEGFKVLEIGCGNGDLSLEIAKNGFNITGIDISQAGINQGFEQAKKEKLDSRASFLVMDATKLVFQDNTFDSVIIAEVFEHVRSTARILGEAIRVVRNGGRIIISIPDGLSVPFDGHVRVFFKDTLENELHQYAKTIEWHQTPVDKWLVCSFFVSKKTELISEPSVDILMPTYNGRKFIRNAIKSVISQTYLNWQLIVINDGGESSEDIINEFKDKRIKYITIAHQGKAAALNFGIKNSNGELITYLDDDDIIYPLHLEFLVSAMLANATDLTYSDTYEVSLDENGRELAKKFEHRQDVARWMLISENYINHKNMLHKRALLEKTGPYDEDLDIGIDWDMIRRLFFVANSYHTWGATSEHYFYYKGGLISNRITGLWGKDPEKSRKSLMKIAAKTRNLSATNEELKESTMKSMLSFSHYQGLELGLILRAKDDEFRTTLQARDSQISELNTAIRTQKSQITDLDTALHAKESQINVLNTALQARDFQIGELGATLKARDSQLNELENQISGLNNGGQARDAQIKALESRLGEETSRALLLQTRIQQSIVMQLQSKYQRVIEKLLVPGSRRRNGYELVLRGIRVILNEGWRSFWSKYRNYRSSKKSLRVKVKPANLADLSKHLVVPQDRKEITKLIEKKISIVIPTKNAGKDFEYTLASLKNQKGIRALELVVVDSGSTDQTIQLAEKQGASVYTIKPEDFNHGLTRNFGARHATGDYILFMVQDAIPIGNDLLYKMAEVLENNKKIAAATCRQVPRSDADMFACFLLWSHYRALDFYSDQVSWSTPEFNKLSAIQKRKLAGLEDVCCLIRKDLFDKYKFAEIQYAEDLELGLRILRDGNGLSFLYSAGIIHSHNRNAEYLFKRTYVDTKYLPRILSFQPQYLYKPNVSINNVLADITALYAALNMSVDSIKSSEMSSGAAIASMKTLIQKNLAGDSAKLKKHEKAKGYLDDLMSQTGIIMDAGNRQLNPVVTQTYENILDDFGLFVNNNSFQNNREELLDSFYKIFAIAAGSLLANYYLLKARDGEPDKRLSAIDEILSRDI